MTVGDEEVILQPLDSQVLARQRNDVVQQAYNLIAENDEWQHLVSLLEGMSRVGNTTTNEALCKLIEEASRRQRFSAILGCLEASKRTGMSLKDKWIARSVLRGIRQMAEEGEWSIGVVQRAVRYTEQTSRLLATKEHAITGREAQKRQHVSMPLTRDPMVTALWLELRAVRAHKAGNDEHGSVATYYERLLGQVEAINAARGGVGRKTNGSAATESHTAGQGQQARVVPDSPNFRDTFFPRLSLWHGVSLAQKLLGRKDAVLDTLANRCGAALDKAVEGDEEGVEQRRKELALARSNLGL